MEETGTKRAHSRPFLRLHTKAGAATTRLLLGPEQSKAAFLLPLPPHPQLQFEVQPPLGPPGEMGHSSDGRHPPLSSLETFALLAGESVLAAFVHLALMHKLGGGCPSGYLERCADVRALR